MTAPSDSDEVTRLRAEVSRLTYERDQLAEIVGRQGDNKRWGPAMIHAASQATVMGLRRASGESMADWARRAGEAMAERIVSLQGYDASDVCEIGGEP